VTIEINDDKISRTYRDGSTPQIWADAMAFIDTPPDYPTGYISARTFQKNPQDVIVYARHPNEKMEKILFLHDLPIGKANELGLLMEKWRSDNEIHMVFSVINARRLLEDQFGLGNEISIKAQFSKYGSHMGWDGSGILGDGLTDAIYEDVVEWIVRPEDVEDVIHEWFGILLVH